MTRVLKSSFLGGGPVTAAVMGLASSTTSNSGVPTAVYLAASQLQSVYITAIT